MRNALPEKPVSPVSVNPKPDLTQMNFGYQIRTQKQPPKWTPLRAFDDGKKTYIQLPPNISINPPLFAQGEHGSTELVNYRVKGDWYIVDRLLDKAELRMGTYPQTVVIIERVTGKN